MKIFVILIYLSLANFCYTQDPNFTQSSENLLYINPAFTGTAENFRAGMSYRNGFQNYLTTNVYADQHIGKAGGIGLSYIQTRILNKSNHEISVQILLNTLKNNSGNYRNERALKII